MTASALVTQSPTPLTTQRILETLPLRVCRVTWQIGNREQVTAGCLFNYQKEVRVISCFGDPSWETARITVEIATEMFYAKLMRGVNSRLALTHDLCVITPVEGSLGNVSSQVFDAVEGGPVLGEKVYFAGYLADEAYPIVHQGVVSSLTSDGFTIDGNVFSGSLGGPVVVERGGVLYLAGVMGSQSLVLTDGVSRFFNREEQEVDLGATQEAPLEDSDARNFLRGLMGLLSSLSIGVGRASLVQRIDRIFLEEPNIQARKRGQVPIALFPEKEEGC